jgi:hypothetical protein
VFNFPGTARPSTWPADLFQDFLLPNPDEMQSHPMKAVENAQKLPGTTKENGWKRNRNSPYCPAQSSLPLPVATRSALIVPKSLLFLWFIRRKRRRNFLARSWHERWRRSVSIDRRLVELMAASPVLLAIYATGNIFSSLCSCTLLT